MFNENEIERLRKKYPVGTRIKLIYMDDVQSIESGTKGTVELVDDGGNIHINWDNGRTLSLIENVDKFEIIKEKEMER